MNPLIFIDRDGVINVDPIGDYIKRWDDFKFEQGALEALRLLSDHGFDIVLISNQAGIGDGVFPEASLWDIHRRMMDVFLNERVNVRRAYYCLHGKKEGCACRKPETGLFDQAARDFSFIRHKTFFIGDKVSDMEAGKRYGLKTAFVRTGHGVFDEKKLDSQNLPDLVADNLLGAVKMIL